MENKHWLEIPEPGKFTRYFYSPNSDVAANFNATPRFLFDKKNESCYECFVCRIFGKWSNTIIDYISKYFLTYFVYSLFIDNEEAAKKYTEKKRRIFPINRAVLGESSFNINTRAPLETIELEDDDDDSDIGKDAY